MSKLYMQGGPPAGGADWIDRASLAALPGWVVALAVGVFAAYLLGVAAGAHRIYPFGDEEAREVMENVTDE